MNRFIVLIFRPIESSHQSEIMTRIDSFASELDPPYEPSISVTEMAAKDECEAKRESSAGGGGFDLMYALTSRSRESDASVLTVPVVEVDAESETEVDALFSGCDARGIFADTSKSLKIASVTSTGEKRRNYLAFATDATQKRRRRRL